jgi:hypothetical protein
MELFDDELMCMSYLYSNWPETGVPSHIGTGGTEIAASDHDIQVLLGACKGKIDALGIPADAADDLDRKQIQCGSEVVNDIPYDEAKVLRHPVSHNFEIVLTLLIPPELAGVPIGGEVAFNCRF